MTVLEHVAAPAWRAAVTDLLAHGERFAAAWASGGAWRAAFTSPGRLRVLSCPAAGAETLVDLVGAIEWDEREAHDLYGLRFAGHVPHRALASPASPAQAQRVASHPTEADRARLNSARTLATWPASLRSRALAS